jgi:hypothetical protein
LIKQKGHKESPPEANRILMLTGRDKKTKVNDKTIVFERRL